MRPLAVYRQFAGKLIGPSIMKEHVCQTLALMPREIINQITGSCWFVSAFEDAWGFTFTGNDFANQHLIFLSEDLLRQERRQIQFTIAHEIGHVILKHRNSVFVNQTQSEIRRQERAADSFAKKYVLS